MHRRSTEHEIEQRAVIDRLDLRLGPVMSCLWERLWCILGDKGGKTSVEAHNTKRGWSRAKHDGQVREQGVDSVSKLIGLYVDSVSRGAE